MIYGFQKHLKGLPRTVAVALHTFFTSLCLNFLASAFQASLAATPGGIKRAICLFGSCRMPILTTMFLQHR